MKKYKLLMLIIVAVFSLSSCKGSDTSNKTEINEEIKEVGGDIPVNRALAAKMLCLLKYDENEILMAENTGYFKDVNNEDYFSKYVYKLYEDGIIHGSDGFFNPNEPLSITEAEILLNAVNDKNDIFFETEDKGRAISYLTWKKAYNDLITQTEKGDEFKKEELFIFALPENSELDSNLVLTDKGEYDFSGFDMESFADKKIEVMTKGNIVSQINYVTGNEGILKGVFFEDADGNNIKVSYMGVSRYLKFDKDKIESNCANITVSDGRIINADFLSSITSSKVLSGGNGYIETEKYGKLVLDENFKVYGNEEKGINAIICGTENNKLYIKDNIVYGALAYTPTDINTIRVVISTTGFNGYVHENVNLTCDKPFKIICADNEFSFNQGDNINITKETYEKAFSSNRVCFKTEEGGKFKISSLERNSGYVPEYEGDIEIEKRDNGFVIVNEVPLEKYLKYVLSSEMGGSFSDESLKTQSVLSRTYAINEIYKNKYLDYGANIDDSVMSQVYNNIPETENINTVLNETEGEVLCYGDEIADVYFFSTSCGARANEGETFFNGEIKDSRPYLSFNNDGEFLNLQDEKTAYDFFRNWYIESFDSDSPYFRWKVIFKEDEAEKIITKNIKDMISKGDTDIYFKGKKDEVKDSDFGKLKDIKVLKRGAGGNVYEMSFSFENNEFIVKTEYSIRKILAPTQVTEGGSPIKTYCKNAVVMENLSMLPSSFFALEKKNGEYYFYGGGNGHGVGLSQFGAEKMAKEGYSYKDILKYYFSGTEIKNI